MHLHPASGPTTRFSTALLALIVLPALALASCDFSPTPLQPALKPQPSAVSTRPGPTRPPEAKGGTLTVRLGGDPQSLNPWLSGRDPNAEQVTGVLFGGLVRLDNHLLPRPDLAESWDVSEDGTALTFHLRRDALWHDGKPLTADDVIWSYNTLARIPADTPALLHIQDTISRVEPVDPVTSTVRFTLKRRYSPILADLSMPILPSHVLSGTSPDKLADSPFNKSPVGTGPFAYAATQAGQSITLKANDRYYGGRPSIDQVAFLVAPEEKVAENAVKEGTLLLAQLSPGAAERLVTGGGGLRGGAYNELGYDFVAFNLRPPHPFSDTRLRKAWAAAIDKQGLTFTATGGGGDPVWSDVSKTSWAYNPDVPRPGGNLDEARALLAEAGWKDTNRDGIVDKNGKPLQINLYVRADNQVRLKGAQNMAEQLAKVGIGVKVEAADFSTAVLARISPNANPPFDFDAVMLGWTRSGPDPDPFALFHSSQIPTQAAPGLLNFTGFSAPEYDDLVIAGRSEYDYGRRKEVYARTQQIIADQIPYYFLWAEKFGVVASGKLGGDIDFQSPRYMWNVEQWWIK